MILWEIICAVLIVSISVGPVGQQLSGWGTPNLTLIVLWLAVWFGTDSTAYRFAIIFGLLLDAIVFLPFGTNTVFFLTIVWLLLFLKRRYLTEESLLHALVALLLVGAIDWLLMGLISRSYDWLLMGKSLLLELIFGVIAFWVISRRLYLIPRWTGWTMAR